MNDPILVGLSATGIVSMLVVFALSFLVGYLMGRRHGVEATMNRVFPMRKFTTKNRKSNIYEL